MAVPIAATAGVASWLAMQQQGLALQSRNEAVAESLAVQLERILALGLSLAELQGFDVQCDEAVARHGGLSFALVLDAAGQPLFRSGRGTAAPPALPALPQLTGPSPALQTADGNTRLAVVPVDAGRAGTTAWVVVGFSRDALLAGCAGKAPAPTWHCRCRAATNWPCWAPASTTCCTPWLRVSWNCAAPAMRPNPPAAPSRSFWR